MENLEETEVVEPVGEEDKDRQEISDANEILTIHLPQARVESPELSARYEPNYVDVEQHKYVHFIKPVMITEQEQLELQQHINNKNFAATASTGSSPDYTEVMINRENFMKFKNNDTNNELYRKYAKHLAHHDEQMKSETPQSLSNSVNIENLMRINESRQSQNMFIFPTSEDAHINNNNSSLKSPMRIKKGKAFSRQQTQATSINIEQPGEASNPFIKAKNALSDSQELLASQERKRNSIVERRYAIRRTMLNSRGLMSITTPVNKAERSANFVFAVANENVSHQIGYNSDLELTRDSCLLCSPEQTPKSAKKTVKRTGAQSGKSKSEHSTVTFLYKDKKMFSTDDIFNYDKSKSDPSGPGPASYYVPRRPPQEKISPSYTFGRRCLVEKKGGGRTSWEKEYYSSPNPFLKKTDFKRDKKWPTPNDYVKKPGFGDSTQITWYQYPTYSIPGTRQNQSSLAQYIHQNNNESNNINNDTNTNNNTTNSNNHNQALPNLNRFKNNLPLTRAVQSQPAPVDRAADINENIIEFILKPNLPKRRPNDKFAISRDNKPKITFKSRTNGTQLWQKPENTPGPGAHDHTKFSAVKPNKPSFKITSTFFVDPNFTAGPYAVI